MAMLAAAGVRFEDWVRFLLPLWLILGSLAVVAVWAAVAVGLR
jgi:uncharacterized ion transporter superfamily protein YfcC